MFRRRTNDVAATIVLLSASAVEPILEEADRAAPDETGGMLLGYIAPDSDPEHVVIETVIGPGPSAKHSRHRFEPDAEWQQEQMADIYAGSGRTTTYLGDWHTHPGGVPVPSQRDRKTARRIARRKSARAPRPLILILGSNEDDEWSAVTYRWQADKLEPVETATR